MGGVRRRGEDGADEFEKVGDGVRSRSAAKRTRLLVDIVACLEREELVVAWCLVGCTLVESGGTVYGKRFLGKGSDGREGGYILERGCHNSARSIVGQ